MRTALLKSTAGALLWLALLAFGVAAPAPENAASKSEANPHQETDESMRVTNAFVRGLPPGQSTTAAYFKLTNAGHVSKRLVGATSNVASRVEIHVHQMLDGKMSMRAVDGIDVPAEATVTFAPGHMHLMFFDLRHALRDGELVTVQLQFADGGMVDVNMPVKSVLAE